MLSKIARPVGRRRGRLWIQAVAAGLASLIATQAPAFEGSTLVVDGDTLMVGSQRVRLWGIDAPEGHQACKDAGGRGYACGEAARDQLMRLIGSARVTCEPVDHDPYGRVVARCRAGATDLNLEMVRHGWAIDYSEFSHGAFAEAEREAHQQRLGVWQGSFERPSAWRAAERNASPPRAAIANAPVSVPSGCRIKGNINAEGRRIFHVPGQEHYDETQISPARGERWFCSASEAQAAGWVAAKR